MSQTARIAVAVVAVVILVIVGWLVFRDGGEEATPLPTPTVAAVPATPTPTLADQLSDRLRGVTLEIAHHQFEAVAVEGAPLELACMSAGRQHLHALDVDLLTSIRVAFGQWH